MDKKTAIDKVRKCMALAKSSNPHEAAAAMRQAQKLMEQFGIEHPDLLAAGVSEEWAKSGATKTPTRYEVVLASAVASAFSCEIVFTSRLSGTGMDIDGGYAFIGVAPSPEVASYTFTVLLRQLKRARSAYMATALKRHTKNKTAAADQFCEGWVIAVRNLIAQVAPTAEQREAIDTYMRINYAQTSVCEPRERLGGNRMATHNHRHSGYVEGKTATLNRGVGSAASAVALLN